MGDTIIRTTTHSYPKREIDIMNAFYGDGIQSKCCITTESHTRWAHVLLTSIGASTSRLKDMLDRGLRQERDATYAAELRENLFPLGPSRNAWFDSVIPLLTIFLHEDVLARILAFELDLAKVRLDSISAGSGDPGRPPYGKVFETIDAAAPYGPVSPHRVHSLEKVPRYMDDKFYYPSQCPGIPSENPFPVLNTLLSLPFSLLHTVPRLAAMLPRTKYQNDVLRMGLTIIDLWFWDPPASLVASVTVPVNTNNINWPPLVMNQSRSIDTFEIWKDIWIPDSADFLCSSDVPTRSHSGFPIVNVSGGISLGNEELIRGAKDAPVQQENGLVSASNQPAFSDTSSLDYYVNSQASSSLEELVGDGVTLTDPIAVQERMVDVAQWCYTANNGEQEDVAEDLIPSPYEQGVIGGMSMNDYLMVHGSIHPRVWLAFLDLSPRVYST